MRDPSKSGRTTVKYLAFFVAVAISFCASSAWAATITWSTSLYVNTDPISGVSKSVTGIDQIDQTGTLKYAVNLGGPAVTLVQSLDPDIDFAVSDADLDISALSNSGSTFRPGLILDTAVWENNGNTSPAYPVTLNNLTIGDAYRIQGLFATPYNRNPRARVVIDGVDYGEGSPGYIPGGGGSYGDARLMTGVFTADATGSQSFTVGAGGPSIISGLLLHNVTVPVPEPSSALLLLGGALGFAFLRRRRRRD